jgi:hypothetical protein
VRTILGSNREIPARPESIPTSDRIKREAEIWWTGCGVCRPIPMNIRSDQEKPAPLERFNIFIGTFVYRFLHNKLSNLSIYPARDSR